MVTNITWDAIAREYERLRGTVGEFCGCEQCRQDVLVYAVNRLPPHYASTKQGTILTELSLETQQERARLDVILLEGFRKVGLAPRCGSTPIQLR